VLYMTCVEVRRSRLELAQVCLSDLDCNKLLLLTCHVENIVNYRTSITGLTKKNYKPNVTYEAMLRQLQAMVQGKVVVLYDKARLRGIKLDASVVIDLSEIFQSPRRLFLQEVYAYTFLSAVVSHSVLTLVRMLVRIFRVYCLTPVQVVPPEWYERNPVLKVVDRLEFGEFNPLITQASKFVFTKDYLFGDPEEFSVMDLMNRNTLLTRLKEKIKDLKVEYKEDYDHGLNQFDRTGFSIGIGIDRNVRVLTIKAQEYGLDIKYVSCRDPRIEVRGDVQAIHAFFSYLRYGYRDFLR